MFIDDKSFALLSDDEKSRLYKVADIVPNELRRIAKTLRMDKEKVEDIPSEMLKTYVRKHTNVMAN